ncbi:unnamed protein product [Penicillium pancosmium]
MGNSTRPEDKIGELVALHGAVPPPYFMFKDTDPYSICWRMGSEVIWDLNPEGFDEDGDVDDHNDHLEPYFKRTEALGFGGEDDYRRGCDEYAEMP